ncbi:MerR family transcriptional regulator [Lutibacter sp. B1]|uniref:MerR family transcriptional regulator n=1 Tax=Lutibacter sp. B1 TaxID=2725996 RepID=UPI001456A578|nr:MerR family transcriptional regulator [Lutibacter sp. B1]NLP58531.1 MerR family transcriptional regulator [Lutibacter sp. B1]
MFIDLPEKRYYKIGEVAKAFGVNTSHIRFWEKEFDVLQPKKNKKGNRLFTQEDIKNLKLIYHLVKEKGYTLEGAKSKMKESPKNVKKNYDIISRLETIKEELLKIKSQIS